MFRLLQQSFGRVFGRQLIGSVTTLTVCLSELGMMYHPTSLLRMIRSLTLIVVLQNQGQSLVLILIEMFSLETLFFAVPVTGIASLFGLVVLHRLLIYPLVAIMGPLLWSGGHQCVRRSQSHWLLGSAGLGDGQLRLLIHRESVSPSYCTLTECRHTRTKGPQRRI